jgi:sulfur-carrier protein
VIAVLPSPFALPSALEVTAVSRSRDLSLPPVRVLLPKSLRAYWDGDASVELDARDVGAALAELGRRYPGLAARILDDQGRLREFVHVFVNRDAVRSDGLARELRAGDVVHILPSVAGGA